MALDDFTTAEETEQDTGAAGLPLASEVSAAEEDVDLFDFPAMGIVTEDERLQEVSSALPNESAAAEARTESRDQPSLLSASEQDAQATAAEPEPEPEPRAVAPEPQVADVDLDEDIFDFGELFTPSAGSLAAEEHLTRDQLFDEEELSEFSEFESFSKTPVPEEAAPPPIPAADPPIPLERAPEEVTQPIEPAPAAPAAPVKSEVQETVHQLARAAPVTPVASAVPTREAVPAAPVAQPAPVLASADPQAALKTPLMLGIAITVLVLNATMIFLAWQASRSFQSAVHGVRSEITRSVQTLPAPVGVQPPTLPLPEQQDPTIETTPNPGTGEYVDPRIQPPAPLEAYEELELSLARADIAEHRFADARKRIHRLLANSDRMGLRESVIADAKYLIAESYLLQARAIEEDGK